MKRTVFFLLLVFSAVCVAAGACLVASQEGIAGQRTLEDLLGSAWEESALFHQPRMTVYTREAERYGFEPRTTDWLPVSPEASNFPVGPAATSVRGATPGEVVAAFAAGILTGLGTELWEVTTRAMVTGDDRSTGAVLIWGFKDDAVAGEDYRLTMTRTAGSGWRVTALEQRYHCARRLADNSCV